MTGRIKGPRKLRAVDRNVSDYFTRLLLCYCIKFNVLYLFADTAISLYRGRFYARCAKTSSLYREYRYIEDRYIRVLSHTFYCNFCRDKAYLSLYRGYRYIEDRCTVCIGVPLYLGFYFDGHISLNDHIEYICNICCYLYEKTYRMALFLKLLIC